MSKKDVVYDALVRLLSPKRSASGWQKFNAVCCTHNGQARPDTRGRGGIKHDYSGTVGYHCFNCGYKARFRPGMKLGRRMKNVLQWAGASHTDIKRIEFDCWLMRESNPVKIDYVPKTNLDFEEVELPEGARLVSELLFDDDVNLEFAKVAEYAESRLYGSILNYELYWTPKGKQKNKGFDLNRRLIIPFKWQGKIVGWTGRLIDGNGIRYFSHEPKDYIFNTESINETDEMIFVVEGPLDALSIDGVGMLGDRCSMPMANWLNEQGKQIIIIPDMQNQGGNLVDIALKNNWSVSFPDWDEGVKDCNDAVMRYGKLWAVQSIIKGTTSSKIKINMARQLIK